MLISCRRTWRPFGQLVTRCLTDFRSDTVTQPSQAMRKAMMVAKVGDDVYKEDPTINELEAKCADLFGMELALFVPTGSMGNLLCLMAHVNGRGEELIIGARQHVYIFEQMHFMQLASIPGRVLPNEEDGTISLQNISDNISDGKDFHMCKTKLVCLENSHLLSGGTPLTPDYMREVRELTKPRGISVHVDGARIYNAAVALGKPVKDLLQHADSVSMCLSKGLGCPVGSVIGGRREFIEKTIKLRKLLGGGIRQGGILAAAGLVALEDADIRLKNDHEKAKKLAEGINNLHCDHLECINVERVRTNIVFMRTKQPIAEDIVAGIKMQGFLVSLFSPTTIRMVTHRDVSGEDVTNCIDAFQKVLNTL